MKAAVRILAVLGMYGCFVWSMFHMSAFGASLLPRILSAKELAELRLAVYGICIGCMCRSIGRECR